MRLNPCILWVMPSGNFVGYVSDLFGATSCCDWKVYECFGCVTCFCKGVKMVVDMVIVNGVLSNCENLCFFHITFYIYVYLSP